MITSGCDYTYLKTFYLLFRKQAFVRSEGSTSTFIERCLAEAKLFEERVAQDISGVVFERVFPNLVDAIARNASVGLARARRPALVLLYRILFLLFAEDRGLLPVEHPEYRQYGLRHRYRSDLLLDKAQPSEHRCNAFLHFRELCRIVDSGDPAIGIPAYNGSLFSENYAKVLEHHPLPDSDFLPVLRDLSHVHVDGRLHYINYRDMSVQQLGSIYERLLEREPVRDNNGKVKIVLNRYARKDSGSYYTPQTLVDLIIRQTLEPLIEDKLEDFENKARELNDDQLGMADRTAELEKRDPATAVLNLKVLDPAMGSGHFLVSAVDFLADYIADLIEYAPGVPEWPGQPYESPVAKQIRDIRNAILDHAKRHNWAVEESQLSDQAIIRRLVLKQSIHGVDKNPLTVELAKVALWLHSFTVGAPLSFLDHHIRCGDSLVGIPIQRATRELYRLGGLFAQSAIESAERAAVATQRIEQIPDTAIEQVHESRALFQKAERKTAELRGILDFVCGLEWLTSGMKKKAKAEFEKPIVDVLEQSTNGAEKLITSQQPAELTSKSRHHRTTGNLFNERRNQIRNIAHTENFLHWEIAFPGVWENWVEANPTGGFDAVIGNPPWERIKFQEKEWLELHAPEIAKLVKIDDRRQALANLSKKQSPVQDDLNAAKTRSTSLGDWVRRSKSYPLLSRGDVNLYSLFVERAESLIKPDGMAGLLVPAGIYADHTAARFFRHVSTNARIRGLYDFENRKDFFKEVHASFKFCVFAFGGTSRRFENARFAFFLRDPDEARDPSRAFIADPKVFAIVNPNTGTAPVFKTTRDADITVDVYTRVPVIVAASGTDVQKTWPIRYSRMFDMFNDSGKFSNSTQLDEQGFYPFSGGLWKRGDEVRVPLYEGKMIQAFNHRAANVVNQAGNIIRSGQADAPSENDLQDPEFTTNPRYWVPIDAADELASHSWFLGFRDVTATTNVRTMIAAIVPKVGCGNTLPVLLAASPDFNAQTAALILANLNSFALDYVARQKIHGTHLTWYAVEQLPVLPFKEFDLPIGDTTARDIVQDHVLRLTYTAHDIKAFATDLGYEGEPFAWDENERMHLRARLDALYFILYGISRDDADYILNTFPIVEREDRKQFGRFRTRDLILGYMNALEAGASESEISV